MFCRSHITAESEDDYFGTYQMAYGMQDGKALLPRSYDSPVVIRVDFAEAEFKVGEGDEDLFITDFKDGTVTVNIAPTGEFAYMFNYNILHFPVASSYVTFFKTSDPDFLYATVADEAGNIAAAYYLSRVPAE